MCGIFKFERKCADLIALKTERRCCESTARNSLPRPYRLEIHGKVTGARRLTKTAPAIAESDWKGRNDLGKFDGGLTEQSVTAHERTIPYDQ